MLSQHLITFIITSVFLINIFWPLIDLQSIFSQSINSSDEDFSRSPTKLMTSTYYASAKKVLKKEKIEPSLLKRWKRLAKTRKNRKLKIKTGLYTTIDINSATTITSIDFKKRAKTRDSIRKIAKQKKLRRTKSKTKINSSIHVLPSRTKYEGEHRPTSNGTAIKFNAIDYPSSDYSVLYDDTSTSESLNYKNSLSQQNPTSPNEDYILEEEENFDQKEITGLYEISTDGTNNLRIINEIKTKRGEDFEDSTTESNDVNKETEEIRNKFTTNRFTTKRFTTKRIQKKFYPFSAPKKRFKLRTPNHPYYLNQVVRSYPKIASTKLKKQLQKTFVPTRLKTTEKYSHYESKDESLKSLSKEDIFRLFKALFIQENKKIEYKIQTAKSDEVTCMLDDAEGTRNQVLDDGVTGSESAEKLFKKLVKYLQKCCNNKHKLPLKNNYIDVDDLKNEKYMMCKIIDKTQQFEN